MKKLKLSLQDFKNTEVLTREDLKTVLGGDGGSDIGGGTGCTVSCNGGSPSCSGDYCSKSYYKGELTMISCDGTSYDCD